MQLSDLVEKYYRDLNESDRYIYQYIDHHQEKVVKMTLQELSRACNVSHSSIVRFSKKLQLDGFSELKLYIKFSLEQPKSIDPYLVHKVSNDLVQTIRTIENRNIDDILEAIQKANRIFLCASGEVQYLAAQEMRRDFTYIGKLMYVLEGQSEVQSVIHNATKDDLFIMISYSGDNPNLIGTAKLLKQKEIPILGIALDTNNLLRSFSKYFIEYFSPSSNVSLYKGHYNNNSHFFIIISMIMTKYLEYIHEQK